MAELNLICGRHSFNGTLLSITWSTRNTLLLLFDWDRLAAHIPVSALQPNGIWFTGAVDYVRLDEDLTVPFLGDNDGDNRLSAYYQLSADAETGTDQEVVLMADRRKVVTVGYGGGRWPSRKKVVKSVVPIERQTGNDSRSQTRLLLLPSFTTRGGDSVWGWVFEQPEPHSGRLLVYSLWITNHAVDRSAKGHAYWATFTGDGHFRLIHSRKEEEKNSTVWDSLFNASSSPITFSQVPRGLVNHVDGTMFLVDDLRGCVYTILGWGRTDLAKKAETEGEQELTFKANGTPFERFFDCPPQYRIREGDEVMLGDELLADPDRCLIRSEKSLFSTFLWWTKKEKKKKVVVAVSKNTSTPKTVFKAASLYSTVSPFSTINRIPKRMKQMKQMKVKKKKNVWK
ncbi:hypothetical protein TYRP_003140, partial [Tyrophagus putrescentiae]